MKKLPGVLYYTAKTRPEDLAKPYPPPISNADRIRAMTDEELAEWGAKGCPHSSARNMCAAYGDVCYRCWLDWLKQEVKDG